MIKEKNKDIKKLDKAIEKVKKREERIRMEELRFKWNCDYYDGINRAEERGERRGERRGEKRGEKAGIIKTAKNMIRLNITKELIMQVTGLNEEELDKLYI